MTKLERLKKGLTWTVPILIGSAVIYWQVTKDALPREILIATAEQGGLYHRFGEVLEEALERRAPVEVVLAETDGSLHNRRLLIQKEADLAVLQAGAVEMDGLAGLVPLYPDVMLVIVRKGRGIRSIADLDGKTILLGPLGSGMRRTAETLLSHHGVQTRRHDKEDAYFHPLLLQDDALDGATVTTGLLNPDLNDLLASGEFDLLDVDDADALAVHHSHLFSYTIPEGVFSGALRIPDRPVHTIATMAFLATRWDASDALVSATLDALYTADLRADGKIPTLIPLEDAGDWSVHPMHPASRAFFKPHKGLEVLAHYMGIFATLQGLMVAIASWLLLVWRRRTTIRRRRAEQALSLQKEALDVLLDKTVEIEARQSNETDVGLLRQCLDDVTETKLEALRHLRHEHLRGDRMFLVFLMQCSHVSREIHAKLVGARDRA